MSMGDQSVQLILFICIVLFSPLPAFNGGVNTTITQVEEGLSYLWLYHVKTHFGLSSYPMHTVFVWWHIHVTMVTCQVCFFAHITFLKSLS